jgi:hypothetical protein
MDDALKLIAGRANLIAEKCIPNDTGMLAVKLSPVELEQYLKRKSQFDQLSVACYNRFVLPILPGLISSNITTAAKIALSLASYPSLNSSRVSSKCWGNNVPGSMYPTLITPMP